MECLKSNKEIITTSIIDTTDIKEDAKESFIRMMNVINVEDWKIWLKEEKEKSCTGLVEVKLFSGGCYKPMEIDEIEHMMDELFKNGGEVKCCKESLFKFYLEGRLIYTVSSL